MDAIKDMIKGAYDKDATAFADAFKTAMDAKIEAQLAAKYDEMFDDSDEATTDTEEFEEVSSSEVHED